jgi:hypothetical protein
VFCCLTITLSGRTPTYERGTLSVRDRSNAWLGSADLDDFTFRGGRRNGLTSLAHGFNVKLDALARLALFNNHQVFHSRAPSPASDQTA